MMKSFFWLRVFGAVLTAAVLAGCSLLRVSVSEGEPLPAEEMRVRTLTRGFYHDLAGRVARAADSIATGASDDATRIAALRWKIRATRAGVEAAMQGNPDVALADLWILCLRMERDFAAAPDSLLFGSGSDIARRTAAGLGVEVRRLARRALPAERRALMERFVQEYLRDRPDETAAENTTLAWFDFLGRNGLEPSYATGSVAEVLADVNDRVSSQTRQLANTVGWSKEIWELQMRQDSLGLRLRGQLDTLERDFARLVAVAEHLPGISDRMLEQLRMQAGQLVASVDGTVNGSMEHLFTEVDGQRAALQSYVSSEREALVEQLRGAAGELVAQMTGAVPGIVGQVLLWVVLAVAVLVGGPFALGFWLGGVRQRARDRRAERTE